MNDTANQCGPNIEMILEFTCAGLSDTERAGNQIASALDFPSCVYFGAEMGMGKTTLCKSIIKSLGYSGSVTSPTYNLIQEYPVLNGVVYHMDLYRLTDAAELEFLALEDLWSPESLFLVEWPERGEGFLQPPTHLVSIQKPVSKSLSFREIVLQQIDLK